MDTSTAERVSHHFNQEGFSSWTLPQLRGYLITSIRRASAHGHFHSSEGISSLQSGGLQLMDSNTSTAQRVSHHFNQEGFSSWTVTLPQLRGYLITSIRRASAHGQ